MGLLRILKGMIVPQLLLGYIFIVSGLIVNFLMLLSCLLWPINRHLYRKINVHLAYSHWCQLTFIAQWWSGSEVLLYIDKEDKKKVGKEHVLVLMNHKYDIDWLMAWVLSERFGMLGGTKIYGKQELKYVPLIGWAWYFTESIFLKRQWEHDRRIISEYLKQITDYPDGYWVTALLFPEGTRFTEEKLRASQEVCRAKGYPLTKHTLLPRTKGFILSVHGMRGKVPALYNCTVGFPSSGPEPNLMNIIKGVPLIAHFHTERIPFEDIPVDSDEACSEWLRASFQKKDELYDNFKKNGKFDGEPCTVPRRITDLLMWAFWAVVTCVPLFYYIGQLFVLGTLTQQIIFIGFVAAVCFGMRLMIAVTETKKGSTYGSKPAHEDSLQQTATGNTEKTSSRIPENSTDSPSEKTNIEKKDQ